MTLKQLLETIMSGDSLLDKLLTVADMHALYLALGVSVRTDIDIENYASDLAATRNSIALLKSLGFIGYRFGRYYNREKTQYALLSDFKNQLSIRINEAYAPQIKIIFSGVIYYDEKHARYYLKRNSIDLSLSGLLMLLSGLGMVEATRSDIFINDDRYIGEYKNPMLHNKQISIMQLKNGLAIKDMLGEEAEKLALKFETDLLAKQGINKTPSIISHIDVSAGYDIVSYLNVNSQIPDKFIEVKSCGDNRYRFFMSKNEIETARNKRNSYHLYLYNRTSEQFRIVQNPYEKVFESDYWAKEPQIYEIHSIN